MIPCTAPFVIDGDSIRCANAGEVRLLGIDAPDLTSSRPCVGHYGDHVCNDRAARQAKWTLRRALRLGPVRLDPVTRDRYGRMIAVAYAGARISAVGSFAPLASGTWRATTMDIECARLHPVR